MCTEREVMLTTGRHIPKWHHTGAAGSSMNEILMQVEGVFSFVSCQYAGLSVDYHGLQKMCMGTRCFTARDTQAWHWV
jgi:hypothetical protein